MSIVKPLAAHGRTLSASPSVPGGAAPPFRSARVDGGFSERAPIVFGEGAGVRARSAMSVSGLPRDLSVEIEAVGAHR